LWLYTSIATSLDESFLLFGWRLLLRPRRVASSECQASVKRVSSECQASDGFELCRIVSYRRREEALLSQWQTRRRFETLTRQGRPSSRAFYWSFRLDANTKGSYCTVCKMKNCSDRWSTYRCSIIYLYYTSTAVAKIISNVFWRSKYRKDHAHIFSTHI
jgi:hypothetical protein